MTRLVHGANPPEILPVRSRMLRSERVEAVATCKDTTLVASHGAALKISSRQPPGTALHATTRFTLGPSHRSICRVELLENVTRERLVLIECSGRGGDCNDVTRSPT